MEYDAWIECNEHMEQKRKNERNVINKIEWKNEMEFNKLINE